MMLHRLSMPVAHEPVSRWLGQTILIFCLVFAVTHAHAHSPFDSTAHVTVRQDRLEASLVVGSGLAKQLLMDSGAASLPENGIAAVSTIPLPLAAQLFDIEIAGTNLPATQLRVRSEELESTFVVTYPRPATESFRLRAIYARHLPASSFSALVVTDDQNRMLGSHIVQIGSETAEFHLPKLASQAADEVASLNVPDAHSTPASPAALATFSAQPQPSFAEYFRMGVHHILTGPDHLLFLCGLLVVSRKFGGVLAIITSFTLAHSITLGLAALNIVSLSARIVEPIIAASIIFVGVENFRHGDNVKARCWLAFGFGLIHGFGLADALRTAGLGATIKSMAIGLFSFNFGVETGQLAVAAIFLALLWQVRKNKFLERYATQTISISVIVLGGWWLLQRTLLA